MQLQSTLWHAESAEELEIIRKTTPGELLLVETDAFPTRGSTAAHAMYAFSGDDENKLFYTSMRSLISSKIGSGRHYHLSQLEPVGGWPEVERRRIKYEGLSPDEIEIMKKADEITRKCAEMKKQRKVEKNASGAVSSDEPVVVKTKTQEKKDRKAAKQAAEPVEMTSKTAELNRIAKEIGPGWQAEKVKAE